MDSSPVAQSENHISGTDATGRLHDWTRKILQARSGSVLARGTILKSDQYAAGISHAVDALRLEGAPNFRGAGQQNRFGVYGVAQPTGVGLRTVLATLNCAPDSAAGTNGTDRMHDPNHVSRQLTWISTRDEPLVYINSRPFVIREVSRPYQSSTVSDRLENLEEIESRLKREIIQEAARTQGLVLVHEEVNDHIGTSTASNRIRIVPSWIAGDALTIQTPREMFESFSKCGYPLDYRRVPIKTDQPHRYINRYVEIIKDLDFSKGDVVFNCGMGNVRTTFGMVLACLMRRRQASSILEESNTRSDNGNRVIRSKSFLSSIRQPEKERLLNYTLLRLVRILEKNVHSSFEAGGHESRSVRGHSDTATELLLNQPALLEDLRSAIMGNYSVVLSLISAIEVKQSNIKDRVDSLIDQCDAVVNLREMILEHRISVAVSAMDEDSRLFHFNKGLAGLERYMYLIAFAAYVDQEAPQYDSSFSEYLTNRPELDFMIGTLRRKEGRSFHEQLEIFAPATNLGVLSREQTMTNWADHPETTKAIKAFAVSATSVVGDEWSDYVVHKRNGLILRQATLLKSDLWLRDSQTKESLPGTVNFREIPSSNLLALGQPTQQGIEAVLRWCSSSSCYMRRSTRTLWLNLREEPLLYINGSPFVLREKSMSLRNMKVYRGISSSRLESLEDRLKSDVKQELLSFKGRLLLHTESDDGLVVPIWEEVASEHVLTLKELMDEQRIQHPRLMYQRLPITSERPLHYEDLDKLLQVIYQSRTEQTVVILNDQLGRGRCTIVSIICLLLQNWLGSERPRKMGSQTSGQYQFQVINSLLRVIRKGLEVKAAVDTAIGACSQIYNLIASIEDSRQHALACDDAVKRRRFISEGLNALRRYYDLIIFQCYLQEVDPSRLHSFETFEHFVRKREEFDSLAKDLENGGISTLTPLESTFTGEGFALSSEETEIIEKRNGSVLAKGTILKADAFLGLQQASLLDRIDGAPNFRQLMSATVRRITSMDPKSEHCTNDEPGTHQPGIYGTGMPTIPGLATVLDRIGGGPEGPRQIYWISMREEPVVYINSSAFVLRLSKDPMRNVEATGVSTQTVEGMESALQGDVRRQAESLGRRILLHDEREDGQNGFRLTAVFEDLVDEDVLTPREVFEDLARRRYRVKYARIPVTDEQSPIPLVYSQLHDQIVEAFEARADLVFNCQMGRGRTTTGMVTACLIVSFLSNPSLLTLLAKPGGLEEYSLCCSRYVQALDGRASGQNEAVTLATPFLKGEYRVILHLVGVLQFGQLAKFLADRAIDAANHVQNLREAIYDYKLRAQSAPSEQRRSDAQRVGLGYLMRYFYIIVFTAWLLESLPHHKAVSSPEVKDAQTFLEWLAERREIGSLAKQCLDFQ